MFFEFLCDFCRNEITMELENEKNHVDNVIDLSSVIISEAVSQLGNCWTLIN